MPYRLKTKECVQNGVQRIALEQNERAYRALEEKETVKAVHELRQRCKKIRALLRLVRPSLGERYAEANRYYRDLARSVAGQRDDQVLIETFDALLETYHSRIDKRHFMAIRQQLIAMRKRSFEDAASPDIATLHERLEQGRKAISEWQLSASGFDAVAGWEETYKRGQKAFAKASASPTAANLHDWRKRVKYHRHHCALLSPLWPALLGARETEAHRLSDCLGDDHDLAVLGERLHSEAFERFDPERLVELEGLIERRRDTRQAEAWPLGQRLFAEPPKPIRRRLKRYWKVARRD